MNGTFNSPAKALAMVVLPHPGGPYKSTPLGGSTPVEEYISGCKIGSPMISNNWVVTLSTPPKDDKSILGVE